jgi:predicted ester cyclase
MQRSEVGLVPGYPKGIHMSDNPNAIERYVAVMNDGSTEQLAAIVTDDFQQLLYGFPTAHGVAGARDYVTMLRTAFPDLQQSIDDMVVSADKIAMRGTLRGTHQGELRQIPPSGNRIDMPYLAIAHLTDGKLSHIWIALDKLEYLQQLGAIPRGG